MSQKKNISLFPLSTMTAVFLFALLSNIAKAQQIGTYEVTNVSAGNALNVRAEHSSKSQDIGSASPGSSLQVVGFSPQGGWAKIKWEQSFGWVSVRFLKFIKATEADTATKTPVQATTDKPEKSEKEPAKKVVENDETTTLTVTPTTPEPAATTPHSVAARRGLDSNENPSIFCTGNGPNWQLSLNQQGSLVFNAPDENSLYATTQWRQSISNKNTYAFAVSKIRGTLLNRACIDKRTNTSMEWQLELHTNGFGGQDQLSGCCTSL